MSSKNCILKNPILTIGKNESKETTYNNEVYSSLLNKKRKYELRYTSNFPDNIDDILSYNLFQPFIISFNRRNQLKMSKEKLDKLFKESYQKRYHKEIYTTELFDLINPYHLVEEKKYISQKYISEEIKSKFEEEKEDMIEREYSLSPNQFYDKKNKVFFGFASKRNKLYKEINKNLIKKTVKKSDMLLVRIKNLDDCFDKNFLLEPNFKLGDLKTLVTFIYKTKLFVQNPGELSLYYINETFSPIYLNNDDKTLGDIAKETKNEFVLDIFINADY